MEAPATAERHGGGVRRGEWIRKRERDGWEKKIKGSTRELKEYPRHFIFFIYYIRLGAAVLPNIFIHRDMPKSQKIASSDELEPNPF